MPEYIYNELETLNAKIYKIHEEVLKIRDKLDELAEQQDIYMRENRLETERDFERYESLEFACERISEIEDMLIEVTTAIEDAQDKDF